MNKWLLIAIAGLAVSIPAFAGDVIDRIVATVNGNAILLSDWDEAVRYEAFMNGRQPEAATDALRKSALDRLIDQELLREQIRASDPPAAPTEEEIARRIQEIRRQYLGAEDAVVWNSMLERYRLTEQELKRRVSLQLTLLRLVDARFRPTVQIDPKNIESYYQQSLLPQLHQSGAKEVPLAEVTPKIKELLTQEKVDQLLTAWLQNLRASSDIHTGEPAARGQAQ